jgi:hypothetical protein
MKRFGQSLAVGMLVGMLGVGACSSMRSAAGGGTQTWTLNPDPSVPGAKGKLIAIPRDGGNTELEVKIEHLPPSEKAFGKQHYVVFLIPRDGAGPQNMGVVTPNKDLKAGVKFNTAFRSFDVVVSAEDEPYAAAPSGEQVFRSTVNLPT